MYELTAVDCLDVSGGFTPLAGLGFAVALIGNSPAIYDFFSGFFDGVSGLK